MFHSVAPRVALALAVFVTASDSQESGPFAWGSFDAIEGLQTGIESQANVRHSQSQFADIDLDGDLDVLVVLADGSPAPCILENDGSGAFSVSTRIGQIPFIREAAFADVDGDGDLDIVATATIDVIATSFNDGLGNFSNPIMMAIEARSAALRTGDLNGDGRTDVVVDGDSGFLDEGIHAYVSNGDGTYTLTASITSSTASLAIDVGDLDGDGTIDVVLADETVKVFSNDGNGDLTPTLSIPTTATSATALRIFDINDDGHLDAVVLSSETSTLTSYLGDGVGGLTLKDTIASDVTSIDWFSLDDIDGDGVFDVFLGSIFSANAEFIRGSADGGFVESQIVKTLGFGGSFDTVDIDGDGMLEAIGFEGDGITILHLGGTPPYVVTDTNAVVSTTLNEISDLLIADADRDGSSDIIVARDVAPTFRTVLNRGGTFVTTIDSPIGIAAQDSVAADLDGDGFDDVATAIPFSNDKVWVTTNTGAGAFTLAAGGVIPAGDGPVTIDAGDINGDGRVDFITGSSNSDTIELIFDNGVNYTIGTPFSYDQLVTGDISAINLGDLDQDGSLDAVARLGARVSTLLGDGAGNLSLVDSGDVPFSGRFHLVDVDGDLDLDLVASRIDRFSVLENDGTGVLTESIQRSWTVVRTDVGDLNGDGVVDIAFLSDGAFGWALGVGDGTFHPARLFLTFDDDLAHMAVADFVPGGGADIAFVQDNTLRIASYSEGTPVWHDLRQSRSGTGPTLRLNGRGELLAGTTGNYSLHQGAPFEQVFLVVGFSTLFTPLKAGLLVPTPDLVFPFTLDGLGTLSLPFVWPAGVPSGTSLVTQAWAPDIGAPEGFTASNALEAITP